MDIMGLGIKWNEVYRARAGPVPGLAWLVYGSGPGTDVLLHSGINDGREAARDHLEIAPASIPVSGTT